ncbi:dihydrodipicolinate synthase family protein [Paenibacillus lupini]|uniref:dihydrodipicolinate synthase family protein n=1 Tax=Paenibacillus lupini TaxID=1450204 RepID=UPI001422BD2B|nr:dihydrodipicolinate synthase family protein [Paenibacillus lupini]NIK25562.1 4-hydroxy-tetrahydrodipicolinate synthase [Paenibacillus lupini]
MAHFTPYSVAIITPYSKEDTVDEASIHRMVQYYEQHQVPALLVSGSTGEQHSLTIEERIRLYQAVKDAASESMPLYSGVAAIRNRDAVRLAEEAERTGMSAIMLGFPPYIRPNQREAAAYVEAVTSAISLPIMLYNNPVRTGFNLEPDTLIRLVQNNPQITALKEAGNPENVKHIKAELGAEFQVLSGMDLTITDYFKKGYDGLTSVAGNLFPVELSEIMEHLRSDQLDQAEIKLNHLKPHLELMGSIGWIRVIRHVFAKQGIIASHCREPLSPLTEEEAIACQSVFK